MRQWQSETLSYSTLSRRRSISADVWVEERVQVNAAHDPEHQAVVQVRAGQLPIDVASAGIWVPDHVRVAEPGTGGHTPLPARRLVRIAAHGVLERLASRARPGPRSHGAGGYLVVDQPDD